MKFKLYGRMENRPHLKVDAAVDPVQFSTAMDGGFSGSLGPFRGAVGAIPLRMAIPFMKRRRRLQVVASIGGFRGRLDAFKFGIDSCAMGFNGTVGTKGIRARMDCQGECMSSMEAAGTLSGRVGMPHLEFGEEEHRRCEGDSETSRERD